MDELLTGLNPIQQAAVKHTDGPNLILAGAGSGKTRVLTHKVAYLIAVKKVPADSILVWTFTNKAAAEMRHRILSLLNNQTSQITPIMGTFHSICSKFLRRDGFQIGLKPNFVIYDENDALDAIKEAMAILQIDIKKTSPNAVRHTISSAKNELINEYEYPQNARGFYQENVAKVYLEYQKILRRNSALDFDDLLLETIRLLRQSPAVLQKYQIQFRYVLVDEYQDTNSAQYTIVKLLSQRHQNLSVVGDASQCLPPGTQINTPNGTKSIENIIKGEIITAAAGRGKTHSVPVANIKTSHYRGKLYNIKTESGKTIKATPNHIFFARLNNTANVYYVYLMFRKDKGYRIGLAKSHRTVRQGRSENGLLVRANQESAEKMWILKVCKDRADANFWEHWFVVEYGIPSMVFSTGGRSMLITQEHINNLFRTINTEKRVQRLFSDLDLFNEYPHHHPKGIASTTSPNRQIVHLSLFSDKRPSIQSPWCGHRVSINTSNQPLQQQLQSLGHYTRAGNSNTWRIETSHWSYVNALSLAEKISKDGGDLVIDQSAFIVDHKKFPFTPASHLRPSMEIGILENGQIITDQVKKITIEEYDGPVYDLDVDILHNYIANGVVVHNSIYAFRGADFRNIVNFQKDYPQAKVFHLEQNYRSTQIILDAAHAIISENKSHPVLKLWTDKHAGAKITPFQARTEVDEAMYVIEKIRELSNKNHQLSDFAVLYRTNAQSRSLEEAFLKTGIHYQLIGGLQFYQRKEIKDVLSYLRLVTNPNDSIAKKRIEKLGKGRALRFFEAVIPLQSLLQQEEATATVTKPTTREILDVVLHSTDYLNYLEDGSEQGKSRIENVKELLSVAEEFPQIDQFLENVALVKDNQLPDAN